MSCTLIIKDKDLKKIIGKESVQKLSEIAFQNQPLATFNGTNYPVNDLILTSQGVEYGDVLFDFSDFQGYKDIDKQEDPIPIRLDPDSNRTIKLNLTSTVTQDTKITHPRDFDELNETNIELRNLKDLIDLDPDSYTLIMLQDQWTEQNPGQVIIAIKDLPENSSLEDAINLSVKDKEGKPVRISFESPLDNGEITTPDKTSFFGGKIQDLYSRTEDTHEARIMIVAGMMAGDNPVTEDLIERVRQMFIDEHYQLSEYRKELHDGEREYFLLEHGSVSEGLLPPNKHGLSITGLRRMTKYSSYELFKVGLDEDGYVEMIITDKDKGKSPKILGKGKKVPATWRADLLTLFRNLDKPAYKTLFTTLLGIDKSYVGGFFFKNNTLYYAEDPFSTIPVDEEFFKKILKDEKYNINITYDHIQNFDNVFPNLEEIELGFPTYKDFMEEVIIPYELPLRQYGKITSKKGNRHISFEVTNMDLQIPDVTTDLFEDDAISAIAKESTDDSLITSTDIMTKEEEDRLEDLLDSLNDETEC